jgi:hypothetical protein
MHNENIANRSLGQSTNESETVPPLSIQTHSLLVILIVIVALITICMIGYILGNHRQPNLRTNLPANSYTSDVQSLLKKKPLIPTTPETIDYKKIQYDPDELINNARLYQSRILNILRSVKNDDLASMKCSPQYQYMDKATNAEFKSSFNYYDRDIQKTVNITDPNSISRLNILIQNISDSNTVNSIRNLAFCETGDGRIIVEYEVVENAIATAYFGLKNGLAIQSGMHTITSISGKSPFFSCPQPLQLTKSNQLYYKCGEGEADSGIDYYYKIDLIQKTKTLLEQCTFQSGTPDASTITCP